MTIDNKTGKPTTESGFLARWSARKSAVVQGEAPDEQPDDLQAGDDAGPADEDAGLSDAALLEKYDLPDPDTIDEEIGLDRFLNGDMPERLRQMALRRLWRLNPLFAVVDDMVEYGEDYTDAATVIEGMQTAYSAGKGYARQPDPSDKGDEAQADDTDEAQTDDADEATEATAQDAPAQKDQPQKDQPQQDQPQQDNAEQDDPKQARGDATAEQPAAIADTKSTDTDLAADAGADPSTPAMGRTEPVDQPVVPPTSPSTSTPKEAPRPVRPQRMRFTPKPS